MCTFPVASPGAIDFRRRRRGGAQDWHALVELESRAAVEESNMVEMPPIPEELARWLLLHEAGADAGPDELAAAGEQVHLRLRAGLIVFLGQTGFDSLWARAMHLAQRTSVSIASTESEGPTSLARGWRAGVSGRNAGEALDVLTVPFASFITLLFSFVGVTLGVRLIQQVWPDLPSFESRAQTGDVTP